MCPGRVRLKNTDAAYSKRKRDVETPGTHNSSQRKTKGLHHPHKKWPKPVVDPEFDQVCNKRKFKMRNGFARFKEACKTVPTDIPMDMYGSNIHRHWMVQREESPCGTTARRQKGNADTDSFFHELYVGLRQLQAANANNGAL